MLKNTIFIRLLILVTHKAMGLNPGDVSSAANNKVEKVNKAPVSNRVKQVLIKYYFKVRFIYLIVIPFTSASPSVQSGSQKLLISLTKLIISPKDIGNLSLFEDNFMKRSLYILLAAGAILATVIPKYAKQLLLVFLLGSFNPVIAAPETICSQRMTLDINGSPLQIAYCGNVNVDSVTSQTDRILVVIHGSNRNASDYYDYIVDAGILAGGSEQTTAIVAPQFLTEDDLDNFNLFDNMLFWSSGGWKKGNTSNQSASHPRPESISSYAVLDELINRLIANNPNASQVVIAGFSAGGQFVNRYTAGGKAEAWNSEVTFRYLSASPSSWLYFSPERATVDSVDTFETPDSSNCPNYNEYKHGLVDLNTYMSEVGPAKLMQNYQERNVLYLLGELDNDPNHSYLETGCSAMLQGEQRLQRGEIYFNHVNDFFGVSNLVSHYKSIVSGVGHSARKVFQSECGLSFLYDYAGSSTACNQKVFKPVKESTGKLMNATFISIPEEDGWVLESRKSPNIGSWHNSTTTGNTGLVMGDNYKNRQYKSILSFDTSSIPEGANIVSASLQLTRGGTKGANPFNILGTLYVDIKQGSFGDNTALQNSDFQAPADVERVAIVTNQGDYRTSYMVSLDIEALDSVNVAGRTQLRLYFSMDDNNNGETDYAGFYSADNSSSARHPRLIVTYEE